MHFKFMVFIFLSNISDNWRKRVFSVYLSIITKSGSLFFTSVKYESKLEEFKAYAYMITTRKLGK